MDRESTTQQKPDPLRLVIAGGGTGGHISPAVAVVEEIINRGIPFEPIWIGSVGGFESAAADELEIPFYPVKTGKLRRYISIHTFLDAARIPVGIAQSGAIVRRFKPHVIFSTGGFVSVPTVTAGWMFKSRSITHEQTASLGLATRINARMCDRTALSYAYAPRPVTGKNGSVVVTGNPVRSALLLRDAPVSYGLIELAGDRPLVYVTGGVQGATAINRAVGDALPDLLEHVEIVHQCGPEAQNHDLSGLVSIRNELPPGLARRYHPVELVGEELRSIYATASLVVSRAGAGTIAELAALGLPSILIPLPGANEQQQNANVLVRAGAAILMRQDRLNSAGLTAQILSLTGNADQLGAMREAATSLAEDESPSARLLDEILDLAELSGWTRPLANQLT